MSAALVAIVAGYLLGSIPFGLVLTRLAGLGDIRAVGSGNIGATNVLRTGRKDIAALTLLLDGGKGAVAALAMQHWAGELPALLAGVAAVIGHCTSPWIGFKGGKGVATALGVILAWSWQAGIACLLVWLAAAYLSKRSSVGGLASMGAAPILLWIWSGGPAALAGLALAAISVFRHQANIARLLAGTEPRIGQGR
ncbi:MAG TPA: glycerol-3-phosphate 1-O-acyltransferase PlsY [Acetobacteraceae bacterium]|nr:glycerol-3-phosphate 1-O-acyltransferase PlsY [Acetobacteraceae bacterium]